MLAIPLALLLSAFTLPGQQVGDAQRDYTVNGSGSGQASVVSTTLDLVTDPLFTNRYTTQDPGAPVIWWISSHANPGQLQIGPNQIDIGDAGQGFNDLSALGDGLEPGFWNALFVTGTTGNLEIGLTVASAAAGQSAHFAMMHFAASSPVGFWFSQTHQVQFIFPEIVVQAAGPDSLNSNPNRGFWSVMHQGNLAPITELVLDFQAASDPIVASTEFDLDQPGLGGRFVFGNGAPPANGTYRNGSELTTGLMFDAQNTFDAVQIGSLTGGNCGFIATNPAGPAFDYRTLRFRFSPGSFTDSLFEFDCDTDAGLGPGGADMAGLMVSVRLQDGTVLQGALAALPGASVSTSQWTF